MPLPRVGARTPRGRGAPVGAGRPRGAPRAVRARLPRGRRGGRGSGRALPDPARGRRGAPRPRLPTSAARGARAVPRRRPGVRMGRRRLPPARRARPGPVRAARGHVHPGGHVRRRGRAPGRAPRSGGYRRGAHAGRAVSRRPQLGIRRCLPVGRARRIRRPGRPAAPGARVPPPRPRRAPGRGLQPPGPRGELPGGLRPVLHRRVPDAVGRGGQLRRPGQRRGARVLHGQRPALGPRIPRGRPPPGRDPRDLRPVGRPVPRGAGEARRRRIGPPGQEGHRGGRDESERRPSDRGAGPRRDGARRDMERRSPPRPAHAPDRGVPRLLRRLRPPRRPRAGPARPLRLRGALLRLPGPDVRAPRTPPPGRPLRRVRAEPRPGRQPPGWRPPELARPDGRAKTGRGRRAALALRAPPLHGGGIRGDGALPLLHQPRGPAARRGGA